MNKVLIEIEYEYLGDFYEQAERIAEGLANLCDPDPRTADSWGIKWFRNLYARNAEMKMVRILEESRQ